MKRFSQIVLVALFVMLFLTNSCDAKWYPGIVHVHSTFSDGLRPPVMLIEQAALSSALFLIVTDHYEKIEKRGILGDKVVKDIGFDNYRERFSIVPNINGIPVPLVIITGAEITAGTSHTLALGDMSFKDEKLLRAKKAAEVIARLKELEILSVAAHPNNFLYRYDKDGAGAINGVEFFNDGSADGYLKTRQWYLDCIKQGKKVFVTSGCDSHVSVTKDDPERWQRTTWVCAEKFTSQAILEAISKGRTIASRENAQLIPYSSREDEAFTVGFDVQKRNELVFPFKLVFNKETKIKRYALYRDGVQVYAVTFSEYWQDNPSSGFKEYWCDLRDEHPPSGVHAYVIEVENFLVTSPIMCEKK